MVPGSSHPIPIDVICASAGGVTAPQPQASNIFRLVYVPEVARATRLSAWAEVPHLTTGLVTFLVTHCTVTLQLRKGKETRIKCVAPGIFH